MPSGGVPIDMPSPSIGTGCGCGSRVSSDSRPADPVRHHHADRFARPRGCRSASPERPTRSRPIARLIRSAGCQRCQSDRRDAARRSGQPSRRGQCGRRARGSCRAIRPSARPGMQAGGEQEDGEGRAAGTPHAQAYPRSARSVEWVDGSWPSCGASDAGDARRVRRRELERSAIESADRRPAPPGGFPVTTLTARDGTAFGVQVIATGLEIPWSLAFAPDGRLFITERPGRVRIFANGQLQAEPALVLTDVFTSGESGILGLALHPDFATNHFVYLTYTATGPNGAGRAARAVPRGGQPSGRSRGPAR